MQMQIIVKSGGNDYHGSVYGDYEDRALQSFDIDSDQIGRGAQGGPALPPREANRVWSDHDLNADVGGYIARDKAWWYLSFREQNVAARVVNFPVRPLRTELVNYTGKVTYEFKPKNRLVLFGHVGRNHQPTVSIRSARRAAGLPPRRRSTNRTNLPASSLHGAGSGRVSGTA